MSGVGYRGRSFGSHSNYSSNSASSNRDGSSRSSDRGYSRDYNSSRRDGRQSEDWSQSRSYSRWSEPQQNNPPSIAPQPWAPNCGPQPQYQDSVRSQFHQDTSYNNDDTGKYNNNYRGSQRNFYSYGRNRYSTPQRGGRHSYYLPYYSAPYRERPYDQEKPEDLLSPPPPPPPPPGSKEERQQKITEAAEELKKKLLLNPALNNSPSFWDDDSAAAQASTSKTDSFAIKSVPALENGPPELSLTTNDLKDIGRVNTESIIDPLATEINQRSSRQSSDDGKISDLPPHSRGGFDNISKIVHTEISANNIENRVKLGSTESTREIKREKSRRDIFNDQRKLDNDTKRVPSRRKLSEELSHMTRPLSRSESRHSGSPQTAQEPAKSGAGPREVEHRGKLTKDKKNRTRVDHSPQREESSASMRPMMNSYNPEMMPLPPAFDPRPRDVSLPPIVPEYYALPPPPPPIVPRPEDSHPRPAFNMHLSAMPASNLPPAPMHNYPGYHVPFVPPLPIAYQPMIAPMEYPPLPVQNNYHKRDLMASVNSSRRFVKTELMSEEEEPIEFPTFPDLPPVTATAGKTTPKRSTKARKATRELDVPLPKSQPAALRSSGISQDGSISRDLNENSGFNFNQKVKKPDEWQQDDSRNRMRLKSSVPTGATAVLSPSTSRVRSNSERQHSEVMKMSRSRELLSSSAPDQREARQTENQLNKNAKKTADEGKIRKKKHQVIQQVLSMSKSDIHNIINASSLKKFDLTMEHLVKEKKSSLSQEMRNTENEKMKMSSACENENFMSQLQAILEQQATPVDLIDLPTTFIDTLSEVLNLNQQEGLETGECADSVALTAIFEPLPSTSRIDEPPADEPPPPPPRYSSPSTPGIPSHEMSKSRKINNRVSKDTTRNPPASTSACYTRTRDTRGSPDTACVRRSTNNLSSGGSGQPDTLNMDDLDDIFEAGIARVKTTQSTTSKVSSTFLEPATPPLPPPPPPPLPEVAQRKMGTPIVVRVERQAVELDKLFTAGIAKAKAASIKAAAAVTTQETPDVPRSRRVARRGGSRSTNANVADTWRRKDVARSDSYRNLTKEEYEAKLGESSSLNCDDKYRNAAVNGSESIAHSTHSDSYYSHSPSHSVRKNSSRSNSEDSRSSSGSSSRSYSTASNDSSSNSSSDEESPSIGEFSKVLRYIKEREKIAKKKSINEEIRDEVNAEIEKKRREKSLKRKAKKSRSKKHEKRKKDKKGKKKKPKRKHRHKSHHSTRSEDSIGEKGVSGRHVRDDQIKREPRDSDEEEPLKSVAMAKVKKSAVIEPVQVSKATSTVTSSPTSQVTLAVTSAVAGDSRSSKTPPTTSTTGSTEGSTTLNDSSNTGSPCPAGTASPTSAQHLKTKAQLKQMPDPVGKSKTPVDESVQSKNSEPVTSSTSTSADDPPATQQSTVSTTAASSTKKREKSPQERSRKQREPEKTGKKIEKSSVAQDDSNSPSKPVASKHATNDRKKDVESSKTVDNASKRTQHKSEELKAPKDVSNDATIPSTLGRQKLRRACKSGESLSETLQEEGKFVNIKSEGGKELKLMEKVKKRPLKSAKTTLDAGKNEMQSDKTPAQRSHRKFSLESKSGDTAQLDIPAKILPSPDTAAITNIAEPMDTNESNPMELSTGELTRATENTRTTKHIPIEFVDVMSIEPAQQNSDTHASIFSHYFQQKESLVSDNLPDTVPEERLKSEQNIGRIGAIKVFELPRLVVNLTKINITQCTEESGESDFHKQAEALNSSCSDERHETAINECAHSSDNVRDDGQKSTNELNLPTDDGVEDERSYTPLPLRGNSPLPSEPQQHGGHSPVDSAGEVSMTVPAAEKSLDELLPEPAAALNQSVDEAAEVDSGINAAADESLPKNQEPTESQNVIDETEPDMEAGDRPVDVRTDCEPLCQAMRSDLALPDEGNIDWDEDSDGDHVADDLPDEEPLLDEISSCPGPEICSKECPQHSIVLNDKVLVAESSQNDILDDPITFSEELKSPVADSVEFGISEDADVIGESLEQSYQLGVEAVTECEAATNDFAILRENACVPNENIMDRTSLADKELLKAVEKKSPERLPSPILQISSKSPDEPTTDEISSEIISGEKEIAALTTHESELDSTTQNPPEIPSSTTQINEPSSSEHEECDKSSETHSIDREKSSRRSVSSVRTSVNVPQKESHRSRRSKDRELPRKSTKSNAITERKKHKKNNEAKRRHNITIERVNEAVSTNIIQIVPKERTKDAVIARMQEIDFTIQRLMNEKMTLYQMLQNDKWPVNEPNNISSEVSASATKSSEKPAKNVTKLTGRQTNDDAKRPAETTVSAESSKSQKQDSQAPTRAAKSNDKPAHRLADDSASKSGRKRKHREEKSTHKGKDTREEPESKRKHTDEPSKSRKPKSPSRSVVEEPRKPTKEINQATSQVSKSKSKVSVTTDTSEGCETTDHSRSMDTPVRETPRIRPNETSSLIYSDDSTWDTFEQAVEKRERVKGLTLLEESMKREIAANKTKNENRKRALQFTDDEDDEEDLLLSKAIVKQKFSRKKPHISRKGSKKHEKPANHVLEVINAVATNQIKDLYTSGAAGSRSDNSTIATDKTTEIMPAPAPIKHSAAVNNPSKQSENLKSTGAAASSAHVRQSGEEESIPDAWMTVNTAGVSEDRDNTLQSQSAVDSTRRTPTREVAKNDAEPTSSTVEKTKKKIRTSEAETTDDPVSSESGRKSRGVNSEHSEADVNELNSATKRRVDRSEAVSSEKTNESSSTDVKDRKFSDNRENESGRKSRIDSHTLAKPTEKKSRNIKKSTSVKSEKHSRNFDQPRRPKSTVKELMRSKSTTKELERSKSTVKEFERSKSTVKELERPKSTVKELERSKSTVNELERSKSTVKELEAIDSNDDEPELDELFRKKRSRHRKDRNTSRSRCTSKGRSRRSSRSRSRSIRKGKSPSSSRDTSPRDSERRRRPASGDFTRRRSNTTPSKSDRSSMDNRRRSRKRKLTERTIEQMQACQVKLIDCKHTYLRPDVDPTVLQGIGVSRINVPRSPAREPSPDVILNNELAPPLVDELEPPLGDDRNRSDDESMEMIRVESEDFREMEDFAVSSDTKDDSQILSTPPSLQTSPIVLPIDDDDEAVTEPDAGESEPQVTQYTVHKGPILDIKVFGDSFFAASEDGSIYRYSRQSNGILNIYKGHEAAVTCLYVHESYGPSENGCIQWHLFSGSLDTTLRCYDIITGSLYRSVAEISSPIQCMDHAWGVIFIGTKSGHISRYDIKAGSLREDKLDFSDKPVLALRASTEGPRKVLIIASRNQPITIRDAQSGLFLRTISGQRNHTVYSLMRERNLVYCGTSSTSIPVFDFISAEQVRQYTAGVGIVCMRLHRQLLFAGCYDGNIYVFDTTNSQLIRSIPGPGNMLLSMEIVDNEIIAGSKDRRLYAWKMPSQIRKILIERM